ncbi:TPA_asm: RNA-directed RNA polymerase [ssRNA phage ESO001]|uniref:RNA-directed RNA polymerase n=1 Tax=ssRNA phage ESO001 TaxID=2786008 RepID=A0A8S5KYF5_9VIRU|nr:RNA-directed RNA polymerase [ssRNA phage ESO001]DAD49922.1 TPA_asm: RNA-directed RNA polymerase [ssRNA phage ESO001]
MNSHNRYLIDWYLRLLVDVREISRVPIGAPDDVTYEWLLIEGPLLDKQVLAYIEGTRAENPDFPEWIKPLWDIFISLKDAEYLRLLRQLLVFCYKAEFDPDPIQLKHAQAQFESTDDDILVWDSAISSRMPLEDVFTSARRYIGSIIYRIKWTDIEPSHGPGAVFPSCSSSEKSRFCTLYDSIVSKYPYDQFFCGIPSFWSDVMVKEVTGQLESSDRIVSKLTAVAKDSRGPRLICVHPKEAIWIQQGQRKLLESAISRHPLTRDVIKFRDQTLNGGLALSSSASGYLCTLDLKEASDRMSCKLIRFLFGDYVYDLISCARSTHIEMLDGRVRDLKKWAPMGNCLTFPVQSLVFFSLVRAGIRASYGVNCDDVYVFGDDILFPVKYYEGAVRALVLAGLVVNQGKTFKSGLFRESCGVDAYNGKDVTPLRIKKHNVTVIQDALSLVNLAKRLRCKGFEHCASSIYSFVRRHYKLPLCNNVNAQGFVEYVDRDLGWLLCNEKSLRFREGLHTWSVPTRMVRSCQEAISKDDWYHLQDSLIRIGYIVDPSISDRGTEYPVPYRAQLSYGWSDCHY